MFTNIRTPTYVAKREQYHISVSLLTTSLLEGFASS